VLADNYQQTQAIALEAAPAAELIEAHGTSDPPLWRPAVHCIAESSHLPDDKGLAERAQQKRGLTAPEIAVLLAYAKIALKEALLASEPARQRRRP
jgi:glutamate dehydrogenase